jgi:hypothetical protein
VNEKGGVISPFSFYTRFFFMDWKLLFTFLSVLHIYLVARYCMGQFYTTNSFSAKQRFGWFLFVISVPIIGYWCYLQALEKQE